MTQGSNESISSLPSYSESQPRPQIQSRRRITGHILIVFVQQILQVGISGDVMVDLPPSAEIEACVTRGVILGGHVAAQHRAKKKIRIGTPAKQCSAPRAA